MRGRAGTGSREERWCGQVQSVVLGTMSVISSPASARASWSLPLCPFSVTWKTGV